MRNRSNKYVIIVAVAVLFVATLPRFIGTALANTPQFQTVVVRLDQIDQQVYTGGSVCINTPASTGSIPNFGSENYVDVGFPDQSGVAGASSDFQVNTTTTNWITSTTPPASPGTGSAYWPTLNTVAPAAWPSIGANAVAATDAAYTSGNPATLKVVRFATGNMVANKTYCFDFRSGTNYPAAETSGTYALKTSTTGTNGYLEYVPGYVATYDCTSGCTTVGAGTKVEQSNWGTQIGGVTGDNSIVISAVVPPIFEMDFASNVDSFPTNLDPNSVKTTTGNAVTVKTNAKGGWMVWTKSKNQALTSAASGGSIPSVGWNTDAPTALTAGTPGYNLTVGVTANVNGAGTTKCTDTVEPEYNGILASFQGGELTPNWEMAADCSTATPPGTDGGTTVTFNENAAISFATPASNDYTDTIYVTGAGQF
jgi:hypothetical protein